MLGCRKLFSVVLLYETCLAFTTERLTCLFSVLIFMLPGMFYPQDALGWMKASL